MDTLGWQQGYSAVDEVLLTHQKTSLHPTGAPSALHTGHCYLSLLLFNGEGDLSGGEAEPGPRSNLPKQIIILLSRQ